MDTQSFEAVARLMAMWQWQTRRFTVREAAEERELSLDNLPHSIRDAWNALVASFLGGREPRGSVYFGGPTARPDGVTKLGRCASGERLVTPEALVQLEGNQPSAITSGWLGLLEASRSVETVDKLLQLFRYALIADFRYRSAVRRQWIANLDVPTVLDEDVRADSGVGHMILFLAAESADGTSLIADLRRRAPSLIPPMAPGRVLEDVLLICTPNLELWPGKRLALITNTIATQNTYIDDLQRTVAALIEENTQLRDQLQQRDKERAVEMRELREEIQALVEREEERTRRREERRRRREERRAAEGDEIAMSRTETSTSCKSKCVNVCM